MWYEYSIKISTIRTQFVAISKLVLGVNAKGPNSKFIERGYRRTRLALKEKRFNFTFLDGLQQIL